MKQDELQLPEGVTPDEMQIAIEAAFLQVQDCLGSREVLVPGSAVLYRARDGRIHTGPLVVVSVDTTCALLVGYLTGNPLSVMVGVWKSQVVRVDDAKGIVHRILIEAHPNPLHSPGKQAPRAN